MMKIKKRFIWVFIILISLVNSALSKPDLVVTDIWSDGSAIWCQLMNTGDQAASAGHQTALDIDGNQVSTAIVNVNIGPGQRLDQTFQYTFQCTSVLDDIIVTADYQNTIIEEDESNNSRNETFQCDNDPPEITSGPTVSDITFASARISWITDEDCNSVVLYDKKAKVHNQQKSDDTLDIEHEIILDQLSPSTVYHYKVLSTDDSNNTVTSEQGYFETSPLADSTVPQIHSISQINKKFPIEFTVDANDDIGMQKVEFYIDGSLVETDFSAPYKFYYDPLWLEIDVNDANETILVEARAFDRTGSMKDEMMGFVTGSPDVPAELDFDSPRDGYDIMIEIGETEVPPGRMVSVHVEASETPWETRADEWGTWIYGTDVNSIEVFFCDSNTPDFAAYNTQVLSGSWDAGGLTPGEYNVVARARSHGPFAIPVEITHTLVVGTYEPRKVEFRGRSTVSDNNRLNFTLKLQNRGDEDGLLQTLHDQITGFVVLPETKTDYDVTAEYDWLTKTSSVTIDFRGGKVIPPMAYYGDTYDVEYTVIPAMYNGFDSYAKGPVSLDYEYPVGGPVYEANDLLTGGGLSLRNKVEDSLDESDYLIVTNPKILWGMNPSADCDQLFGTMAELAMIRNGVFGFFEGHATVNTRFDYTDRLAVGEIFPDTRHRGKEILIAEDEEDRVIFYDAIGYVDELEYIGLNKRDTFAVGNVIDVDPLYGSFAAGEEILIADGYEGELGRINICQYLPVLNTIDEVEYFDSCYENGDALAVGDVGYTVAPLDTLEEIIVAHDDDNTIYIYDADFADTWREARTITCTYETDDGFAVGNVCGDHKDEIIVADIDADTIYVYDDAGAEHSFSYVLESGDRICVADVAGGRSEDIIIFMQSRDRIEKISCSMSTSGTLTHLLVGRFDYYLHSKDGFAAGDVLTCSKSEILVGRGHRANERNVGEIELIASVGGLGPSQEREAFDALIDEGGAWANKMRPGWASGDYLLIVGETQILPSYNRKYDLYYTENAKGHHVRITDNHYADTSGDGAYWPDLAMGRIIGNTAEALEKPLLWSLGLEDGTYTLDNPFAITASGSDSEDDSRFRGSRNDIDDMLTDEGYSTIELRDPNAHQLLDDMTNKTVLFLSGHGNTGSWNGVRSSDVASLFRPDWGRPLVYADSCLTGRYADGYGFAEAFLEHGASMYLGATESTYSTWSRWLSTRFFDRFIDLDRTAGVSLLQSKRNIIGAGRYWWDRGHNGYISAVTHLYGDPKLLHNSSAPLMGPTVAAAALMSMDVIGPVSTLQMSIPAYDVNNLDGIDYVTIPDGSQLLVPQRPEVPSYSVDVSFPAGYRVQNVTMASRTNLSTASGLDLPLVEAVISGPVIAASEVQSPDDQWWPDRDFDWVVIEEPNSLTTLRITVYPFYYKAATTAIEFYQTYSFDIDYISSDKSIVQFKTDKVAYAMNETVNADLYIMLQEQQGIDLIVEAAVKTSDEEIVAGMEIQKMTSVTSLSSCSFQFDSAGFDAGDYIFEAEVKYIDGSIVAKENCQFNIGQSQGQVTDLLVAPACFSVGNNVDITAVFSNTGESPITGSLAIEIKDLNSTVVEEFHQDFNDLTVNGTNSLNVLWQNAQLGRGDCRIVATAYYDGKTATKSFPDIVAGSDINEDGQVNFYDFAVLAQFWQLNYGPADIAPPGGDCVINYYDLQAMLENWLTVP